MQKLALTLLAGLCTTLLYAAPSIEKKEEKLDRKGTTVLSTRYAVNLGNGKINYHTVTNPNDNKPVQQEWGISDSASNIGGTPILPEAGVPSISLP